MSSNSKSAAAALTIPSPLGEQAGRVLAGVALITIVFAAWAVHLGTVAEWTMRELRVLPTLSVFALCTLVTLVVQGGRLSNRSLLYGGLSAAIFLLAIQYVHHPNTVWIDPAPIVEPPASTDEHAAGESGESPLRPAELPVYKPAVPRSIGTEWVRFELAIFAAVLLGAWLGRGVSNSGQFVAFVMCAAAGNIWLNTPLPSGMNPAHAVPEAAGVTHPLSLLRIPWPPQIGLIGLSPSVTEILCFSAVLEAARQQRFHVVSIVFGAFAGFCGGSFLALDPPAWPALPSLMCGVGTLVAGWPDLKMKAHDAVRALLIGVTLMVALLGLAVLRRKLAPPPEVVPEPTNYPGTTLKKGLSDHCSSQICQFSLNNSSMNVDKSEMCNGRMIRA